MEKTVIETHSFETMNGYVEQVTLVYTQFPYEVRYIAAWEKGYGEGAYSIPQLRSTNDIARTILQRCKLGLDKDRNNGTI